jgi:uncharacterized protein YndB with AHSA1/START domain
MVGEMEKMKTEENALVITREFDAPRERVWKAWTDPEMLKRWWGPEMFTAPSIKVDLRVGGKYVFAMRGPEGTEWDKVMYSAGIYKEIIPNEKLVSTDFFSDEDGNMLDPTTYGQPADAPREMTITVLFEEIGKAKTRLSIIYKKPETEGQYQAMLRSGMTEGWNSSLNKLAEALK